MNDDDTALLRGIELHKAGHLAEAETIYTQLLLEEPGNGDVLHFLGMLRMHQGRRPAAIELLQRSLKILPDNPHAWNNLGNLMMADGREDAAEHAYIRATNIAPDLAEAMFNLGVLFRRKRRPEDALKSFRAVLDSNPRFSGAYESLGLLLYRMGRNDDAADVYRKWLEVEPEHPVARHMWSATSGQSVPTRADHRYITKVFDQFANSFDEALQSIGYAVPQLLSAALAERIDFGHRNLDVLDVGCGTGLCGLLLRSSATSLVGVDLSSKMLAKAREREVYDELVEAELCAFMRSRPARFDLVNCADTLIYFGDLSEPIVAARLCLKPKGFFGFAVEAVPEDSSEPYRLYGHGRYGHSADYVVSVMQKGGFIAIERESIVLRKERGEDVRGHMVIGSVPG
jgi:predicted TPR repeat methyltransferase